jgi:biotin carboxyl carrier protein
LAKEVVTSPMTGKIISVEVKVGDKVKEEDTICILESMKMENPIVAPVSGTIVELNITPGQTVESGKTMAVIEY